MQTTHGVPYSPKTHGNVIQDGRWMFSSPVIGMITSSLFFGSAIIFFIIVHGFGFFIIPLIVFLLTCFTASYIIIRRYKLFSQWLNEAKQNGIVSVARIKDVHWSFFASSLSGIYRNIYQISYEFQVEGEISKSSGFVKDFNPRIGAQVYVLIHDGRSAIINFDIISIEGVS